MDFYDAKMCKYMKLQNIKIEVLPFLNNKVSIFCTHHTLSN